VTFNESLNRPLKTVRGQEGEVGIDGNGDTLLIDDIKNHDRQVARGYRCKNSCN